MDDRLEKLKEIQKKREEIEIAKNADRLMAEGGTDSDPAMAQLDDDGNASRQIYSAIGHETLQSDDGSQFRKMMENAKPSLSHHDNQHHSY